jgi:imidazolonepropionase-like amidohydrolase
MHIAFLLAAAVAFENVNVVPMDRERVVERQTVVVVDGRISEMGPAGKVKAPAGAVRVDGRGKYLMPGLAEMHGHLPTPQTPAEVTENILFLYVANGVTTVRGMLGHPAQLDLRKRTADGSLLGPTLYLAGPAFTGQSAPSVEVAQKMVREQKAAGYDLLKIQEGLKPEVYDAIVATAREVGIKFGGHVPNDVGVERAIAARQSTIDHLDNYLDALEADNSPLKGADPEKRAREVVFHLDERKMPVLARKTREAGVWNVPTMKLWETFFNDQSGEAMRASMPEVKYLPRPMVDGWVKQKDSRLPAALATILGFETRGKVGERVIETRLKMLRALHDGKCKFLLGTDSPQVFSVPGFSIHREMPIWVQAGFRPYEVMEAGTRNVAEYFGAAGEFGTVAVGKRADLVLLEGNPLADVGNAAKRAGVMVRGRWLTEGEIQERLSSIGR